MVFSIRPSLNVCLISDFEYTLLFQYLDKMIKRGIFKKLRTHRFKLLHLTTDVEMKINFFFACGGARAF